MLYILIFLVACSTDGNISGGNANLKIVANAELARVFDGATDDKSIAIEKVSGTVGIVADKIVFKVLTDTFQNNPDVAITFDTTDNDDGGKKIMSNCSEGGIIFVNIESDKSIIDIDNINDLREVMSILNN